MTPLFYRKCKKIWQRSSERQNQFSLFSLSRNLNEIILLKFHLFRELILWRKNLLTFSRSETDMLRNRERGMKFAKNPVEFSRNEVLAGDCLNDCTRKIDYSNISSNCFMVHLLFLQKLSLISENLIRKKLRSSFFSRYNTGL